MKFNLLINIFICFVFLSKREATKNNYLQNKLNRIKKTKTNLNNFQHFLENDVFIYENEKDFIFNNLLEKPKNENIFDQILEDVYMDKILILNERERLNQIKKFDVKRSMFICNKIMLFDDTNLNDEDIFDKMLFKIHFNDDSLVNLEKHRLNSDNKNGKISENFEQYVIVKNNICKNQLIDNYYSWIDQNFSSKNEQEETIILDFNLGISFFNQLIDLFFFEYKINQKFKKYHSNSFFKKNICVSDVFRKKKFTFNFDENLQLLNLNDENICIKHPYKNNEIIVEKNKNLNDDYLSNNCRNTMESIQEKKTKYKIFNSSSYSKLNQLHLFEFHFDIENIDFCNFFKLSKNLLASITRFKIPILNKDFVFFMIKEISEIKFVLDRTIFFYTFFRILMINYNVKSFLTRFFILIKTFKAQKLSVYNRETLKLYLNFLCYMILFSKCQYEEKLHKIYIEFEKKFKYIIFRNDQTNFNHDFLEHFAYTITCFQKSYSDISLIFSQQSLKDDSLFKDKKNVLESNLFLNFTLKILNDNNLLDSKIFT